MKNIRTVEGIIEGFNKEFGDALNSSAPFAFDWLTSTLKSLLEELIAEGEEERTEKYTWRTNKLKYPTKEECEAHNAAISLYQEVIKKRL